MASLTKKIIGGRPYYYLRECQRINGKPTILWQKYIGSAEQLVRQLAEPAPQKAVVRESASLHRYAACCPSFSARYSVHPRTVTIRR